MVQVVQSFQFTTSQGGRHYNQRDHEADMCTFNSRPHKEVDPLERSARQGCDLSIHDLTRRSTETGSGDSYLKGFQFTTSQGGRRDDALVPSEDRDFQFTTSQGGRLVSSHVLNLHFVFQFTTSQGGRLRHFPADICYKRLSIHDLTRRSTDMPHHFRPTRDLSIHDLTRRSTSRVSRRIDDYLNFQFTTSQGGRLWRQSRSTNRLMPFNSRPHKEVDCGGRHIRPAICLSIHDLTRRSTDLHNF